MTGPHVIDPNAVYTVPEVVVALSLRKSTVAREVREGRLTVSRRAGKYYVLGKWLLAWIEAGVRVRADQAGATARKAA